MDFELIKNNLMNAAAQLLSLRVIVTSPSEKAALYVLLAALLAPGACAVVVVLGFLRRYAIRFEKDATKL